MKVENRWSSPPERLGGWTQSYWFRELEAALLCHQCSLDAGWPALLTKARCRLILPHVCSTGSSVIMCSQLANNSLQLISFPNKIFLSDRETDHFN